METFQNTHPKTAQDVLSKYNLQPNAPQKKEIQTVKDGVVHTQLVYNPDSFAYQVALVNYRLKRGARLSLKERTIAQFFCS